MIELFINRQGLNFEAERPCFISHSVYTINDLCVVGVGVGVGASVGVYHK